jgi:hypothetical protein
MLVRRSWQQYWWFKQQCSETSRGACTLCNSQQLVVCSGIAAAQTALPQRWFFVVTVTIAAAAAVALVIPLHRQYMTAMAHVLLR